MSYVMGFVAAVPAANRQAYGKSAESSLSLFKEFGATRMVETWGDDVPDGKLTDFKRAVLAKPDEVIVFSWLEFADKAAADAANAKMTRDPRMAELGKAMPFDAQRMIYGGFSALVDERLAAGVPSKPGYVDGSLVPVPVESLAAYRTLAEAQAAILLEHGALRVFEGWGQEVPEGKITDFKRAVHATSAEQVVFSWLEWPSKELRDQAWQTLFADPRMQPIDLPYDNARRVHGGFLPILDE